MIQPQKRWLNKKSPNLKTIHRSAFNITKRYHEVKQKIFGCDNFVTEANRRKLAAFDRQTTIFRAGKLPSRGPKRFSLQPK
jgi:hypothetical protein